MGQSGDGDQVLLTELTDSVLILTLNRDQARNALSLRLIHALDEALTRLEYDNTVYAGVITGAGRAEVVPVFVEFEVAVPHLRPAGW